MARQKTTPRLYIICKRNVEYIIHEIPQEVWAFSALTSPQFERATEIQYKYWCRQRT